MLNQNRVLAHRLVTNGITPKIILQDIIALIREDCIDAVLVGKLYRYWSILKEFADEDSRIAISQAISYLSERLSKCAVYYGNLAILSN